MFLSQTMRRPVLLERLVEYSQQLNPQPTLYGESVVRYIVELDPRGSLTQPRLIDTANSKNPSLRRGARMLMPQIRRAKGVSPIIFASNAEYTFGLARDSQKQERVDVCHHAYMKMLARCVESCNLDEVQAVFHFLQFGVPAKLALSRSFDRSAAITFRVQGRLITDLPAVQQFWARECNSTDAEPRAALRMQCVVCREIRPVVRLQRNRIKGIPGGHRSGTVLVSASSGAWESYGLRGATVAPTCGQCAELSTRALNQLLASAEHHVAIANTGMVFWTQEPSEIPIRGFLSNPSLERLGALQKRGSAAACKAESVKFFAAAFTANGARAVMRTWLETDLNAVKLNLGRWFHNQSIIGSGGGEPQLLSIRTLARATVREFDDIGARVVCALIHCALGGAPLPEPSCLRRYGATVRRTELLMIGPR